MLIDNIENLKRVENTDKDEMGGIVADLTHAVYPHDEVYGGYCPIQSYIDCPPEKVFEFLYRCKKRTSRKKKT